MRITAVTCVKNEGPFLLEWIAFNRLIGVTDHLFYSNDCSDGTDTLLDALQSRGLAQHLPNPAEGRNYQMEALADARRHPIVSGADWVWVADVDEFLNIHVGDGTIPELIASCGTPEAISIHFQFFANCGVQDFQDTPVISQFTHSHNPDIWVDQTAQEVKTLTAKSMPVKYFGAHRPFLRDKAMAYPQARWSDGSGRSVPENYFLAANKQRLRKFPAHGARKLATLNHYALRSLDSYLVKNDRGDVNRDNRNFDTSYWQERNDDAYHDTSIQRYLPALTKALDELKSDPELAALHNASVQAHLATRDRLMQQPAYQNLRADLLSLPKISDQEQAIIDQLETT